MRKTVVLLLATLVCFTTCAQTFEGRIVYRNTYKSKIPGMKDEQFNAMMGTTQEYFIKDGNYKSVSDGTLIQWRMYNNADNKIYNKMKSSETILYNDASVNNDEILNVQMNEMSAEILGFPVYEVVLTCKSGMQKYYFTNKKFAVDASLFAKHTYGNWFELLKISKALPLKSVIDTAQFSLESTATEFKEMSLEKTFFELPANAKTVRSPY